MLNLPDTDDKLPVAREMAFLKPLFERLAAWNSQDSGLPFVTLSYAQSIDGSIAVCPSQPCDLSSGRSLDMTHLLRSRHDALLVGINTVLVDDPRLTVRRCEGRHPQPVVLDSHLRFPDDARLMFHPDKRPILFTTAAAPAAKFARLSGGGASIRMLPRDRAGRVDLLCALQGLAQDGIKHLMVEGGATVINAFLQNRLVDYCIITVAPRLIGGLKAVDKLCASDTGRPLSITDCLYQPLGGDLIIHGRLEKA